VAVTWVLAPPVSTYCGVVPLTVPPVLSAKLSVFLLGAKFAVIFWLAFTNITVSGLSKVVTKPLFPVQLTKLKPVFGMAVTWVLFLPVGTYCSAVPLMAPPALVKNLSVSVSGAKLA